jgi:hypothetical protein
MKCCKLRMGPDCFHLYRETVCTKCNTNGVNQTNQDKNLTASYIFTETFETCADLFGQRFSFQYVIGGKLVHV